MEELAEEGRIVCECSARRVERRGCRRTAVKRLRRCSGFYARHKARQGRRLLCWSRRERGIGWRSPGTKWAFKAGCACSGPGDRQEVFPS